MVINYERLLKVNTMSFNFNNFVLTNKILVTFHEISTYVYDNESNIYYKIAIEI